MPDWDDLLINAVGFMAGLTFIVITAAMIYSIITEVF